MRRTADPFNGDLALPGGAQKPFESFESTIIRVLKDKLGLKASINAKEVIIETLGKFPLQQFKTYDSGTDKRGGNTTVFAIETDVEKSKIRDLLSGEVRFVSREKLPKLAFDHTTFVKEYFYHYKNYAVASLGSVGVAIDIVIFTVRADSLRVLLTKRSKDPFKGYYTLPGGFVKDDLSLEDSAKSVLQRDTNIKGAYLEQLFTFGDVIRDPRGRVISITYYALLDSTKYDLVSSSKYDEIGWFDVDALNKLDVGFDHRQIIDLALSRIQNKIEYTNIAFQLLPEKFTLSELQKVYEVILAKEIDKRNFRKKVAEVDLVEELNEFKKIGRMRPAKYFRFKERKKETLLRVKKWV